MIGIAMMG